MSSNSGNGYDSLSDNEEKGSDNDNDKDNDSEEDDNDDIEFITAELDRGGSTRVKLALTPTNGDDARYCFLRHGTLTHSLHCIARVNHMMIYVYDTIDGGRELIVETGVIGKPGRKVTNQLRSAFHALATLYRMLRRYMAKGFTEVPNAPSPLPL